MDTLQQVLNQQLAELPFLFLEKLVSKKLRKAGINPTESLVRKISQQVINGREGSFEYEDLSTEGDIKREFPVSVRKAGRSAFFLS